MIISEEDYLAHFGIKGMRWGVRKAKKQNEKVDKSFKKWQESDKARDDAISLGKQRNAARLDYEKNPNNKDLRKKYHVLDKSYKEALKTNTTYRKGVVRQEVGRDASRKYLSAAKKLKNSQNPADKKKYKQFMNAHEVERAKARKAIEVSSKRSNKKASIKRKMTIAFKTAAAGAAVTAGAIAINQILKSKNATVNGKPLYVTKDNIGNVAKMVKKGKDILGYFY